LSTEEGKGKKQGRYFSQPARGRKSGFVTYLRLSRRKELALRGGGYFLVHRNAHIPKERKKKGGNKGTPVPALINPENRLSIR